MLNNIEKKNLLVWLQGKQLEIAKTLAKASLWDEKFLENAKEWKEKAEELKREIKSL